MSQPDKQTVRNMVILAVAKDDHNMRVAAKNMYWEVAL